MDEYYFNMIYNLALVKRCYDYDKGKAMKIFGDMYLCDHYSEEFIDYCFKVVSYNTHFYFNEHKYNYLTGEKCVQIMTFKHPAICKAYGLYARLKKLRKFKFRCMLQTYIDEAEKSLKFFAECFEEGTIESREDGNGIINRFYLEKMGFCIDFTGALSSLIKYVSILEKGYLTVSNMLYDRGVEI